MKKILLSLILSSLSLLESQAISTKNLGCQFHNSRKCAKPKHFEKELGMGCASPAGNCRYQFCKSNCLVANANKELASSCKKNCNTPALLSRFSEKNRTLFYQANFPQQDSGSWKLENSLAAYVMEEQVQKKRSKQWWRLGRRSKDSALQLKLVQDVVQAMQGKAQQLIKAESRKDLESVSRIEKEMVLTTFTASQKIMELASYQGMPARQKALATQEIAVDLLEEAGASTSTIKAAKQIARVSPIRPTPAPRPMAPEGQPSSAPNIPAAPSWESYEAYVKNSKGQRNKAVESSSTVETSTSSSKKKGFPSPLGYDDELKKKLAKISRTHSGE